MNRPKLLITGASGFLGWHLCRLAQPTWQVYGTYHRHGVNLAGVTLQALDLTQAKSVWAWLAQLAPDAVIHTAALAQPNRCEVEPDLSYAVNVEATCNLAQFCGDRQIPLVFTSTDQVFDGRSAPYCETDSPTPVNCYGQHKVEAERLLRQIHPSATICRLPLLYGPPSPQSECFLQGFVRTLAAGQPLHLFTDEFRSPAYVDDVVAGLELALASPADLLHLSGPERWSRYDFGVAMAKEFGLDVSLIQPCRQKDVVMPAARPADVTCGNHRAVALGYAPRGVVAGLRAVRHWSQEPPGPSSRSGHCQGLAESDSGSVETHLG